MTCGIVDYSMSPQRMSLVGRAVIPLNQDFDSVFLAETDIKNDYNYRSKPGLAHIGPDMGP